MSKVPTTPETYTTNHLVLLQCRVPRPLPVVTDASQDDDGEAKIQDAPTIDVSTDFSQAIGSDINEVPSQIEITETRCGGQKLGYKGFLYIKTAQ